MSLPKTHTYTLTPCFGCTYSTCRHKHTHTHTHTYTHTSHIRHTHRHTNTHTHHTCRNTHRHTHANTHTHTHTQTHTPHMQTHTADAQWQTDLQLVSSVGKRLSSAKTPEQCWKLARQAGRHCGLRGHSVSSSQRAPKDNLFHMLTIKQALKILLQCRWHLGSRGHSRSVYGLCTWRAKIAPFWWDFQNKVVLISCCRAFK